MHDASGKPKSEVDGHHEKVPAMPQPKGSEQRIPPATHPHAANPGGHAKALSHGPGMAPLNDNDADDKY